MLQWDGAYLRFRADEDTDSIEFEFSHGEFFCDPNYRSAPWKQLLGNKCGWTWVATNHQGYRDSVMLSFDGIVPSVLLHVIASSIKVLSIGNALEMAE